MALTDFLDRVTLTRRLVKAVERTATALEQQNVFLLRLTEALAPQLPIPSDSDLRTAGPTFLREAAAARYVDWSDGFLERHGREPSDEEIEEWLAEDAERQA